MATITDAEWDRLSPERQIAYSRVRRDGVAQWVDRATLEAGAGYSPPVAAGGRLTDAELDKMTVGERYNYAKQFNQKQFQRRS
jgi:hypothetical protein